MYNSGLFSTRQEPEMPVKKAASKKRKQTRSRKKPMTRKSSTKKKATKKTTTSKKRAPARKRVTKKKVAKKKVAKKKATKKKPASKKKARVKKKSAKKAGRKKPVSKKKPAARKKKTTKKRPVSRKKAASKKRPASKKKAAARKRVPSRKPAARKTPARPAKRRSTLLSGPIHGIAPYKRRRGEAYMSDAQVEHFRKILSAWKRELIFEVDRTVHHMQDEAANFPDPNDRATQESEFGLELRTRDRERKLLRKIDQALARLDEGSYGYCDETGEEIGLKRLEARPVATLCLEAQERRELAERQFRDRDDRYR